MDRRYNLKAEDVIDQWKESKSLDFDVFSCKRLYDAFVQAGYSGEVETLCELIRLRNFGF